MISILNVIETKQQVKAEVFFGLCERRLCYSSSCRQTVDVMRVLFGKMSGMKSVVFRQHSASQPQHRTSVCLSPCVHLVSCICTYVSSSLCVHACVCLCHCAAMRESEPFLCPRPASGHQRPLGQHRGVMSSVGDSVKFCRESLVLPLCVCVIVLVTALFMRCSLLHCR